MMDERVVHVPHRSSLLPGGEDRDGLRAEIWEDNDPDRQFHYSWFVFDPTGVRRHCRTWKAALDGRPCMSTCVAWGIAATRWGAKRAAKKATASAVRNIENRLVWSSVE